jgi:N-acetylmuramoyl-L-alanine amidase CwlA
MRAVTSLPHIEMPVANGNFDTSRATIDRVIIHTTNGTAQGAEQRFNDPSSKVSAHYMVCLDGTFVHFLEEYYTAYQAGDYPMNQRSVGIEHEDGGNYNGVRPDVLYTASAKLVRDICQYYNIPINRQNILKHKEVSDAPTGCPDALDIERIVREATGGTHGETFCTVTVDNLNIRTQPTSQSALVATYSRGTVLNFIGIVNGENVDGNPRWGHSQQGHYFWLGGTDHPNG